MAKILKPHRGLRANAISNNVVLAAGEIFFELPTGGEGTGEGKIYMGDGTTGYSSLPPFIDPTTKANQPTTITYEQYLQMSEQEREAGDWFVTGYPGVEGAGTLQALEDVALDNPVTGDVLTYDNTTHTWKNQAIPSDTSKADKVSGATNGDVASLDSNGNIADSGVKAAEIVTADTTTHIASTMLVANAAAVADLSTKQVRNIYAGTADLTPGTSALPSGDIYICYE